MITKTKAKLRALSDQEMAAIRDRREFHLIYHDKKVNLRRLRISPRTGDVLYQAEFVEIIPELSSAILNVVEVRSADNRFAFEELDQGYPDLLPVCSDEVLKRFEKELAPIATSLCSPTWLTYISGRDVFIFEKRGTNRYKVKVRQVPQGRLQEVRDWLETSRLKWMEIMKVDLSERNVRNLLVKRKESGGVWMPEVSQNNPVLDKLNSCRNRRDVFNDLGDNELEQMVFEGKLPKPSLLKKFIATYSTPYGTRRRSPDIFHLTNEQRELINDTLHVICDNYGWELLYDKNGALVPCAITVVPEKNSTSNRFKFRETGGERVLLKQPVWLPPLDVREVDYE